MSWQQYLLVPILIWHGVRAPRGGPVMAWNRYWSNVRRTGEGGEVLWDSEGHGELEGALARMLPHTEFTLPIIDLGCGNGRHTRALSAHFPKVLGVDMSAHAIKRAEEESSGAANVSYRVLDATAPGAGQALSDELGEANVYVRGILHILDHRRRLAVIQNLRDILGQRGTLYLVETAFPGSELEYLTFLGSTPTGLPGPVQMLIEAGLDPPEHFDEQKYHEYFSESGWTTLESGTTIIQGVSMCEGQEMLQIPGFFAIARRRPGSG